MSAAPCRTQRAPGGGSCAASSFTAHEATGAWLRSCLSKREGDQRPVSKTPVERRIIPGLARLPRRAGATETMGCHAPHGRARCGFGRALRLAAIISLRSLLSLSFRIYGVDVAWALHPAFKAVASAIPPPCALPPPYSLNLLPSSPCWDFL
ncbi:hypothetical protein VTN02DRAFT_605 [Thermoascus thermophilus]